jgi:hypothetical protein
LRSRKHHTHRLPCRSSTTRGRTCGRRASAHRALTDAVIFAPHDSTADISKGSGRVRCLHGRTTARRPAELRRRRSALCDSRVPDRIKPAVCPTHETKAGHQGDRGALVRAWACCSPRWAGHAADSLVRRDGRRSVRARLRNLQTMRAGADAQVQRRQDREYHRGRKRAQGRRALPLPQPSRSQSQPSLPVTERSNRLDTAMT